MTQEALKLALEALEYRGVGSWRKKQPAITAIKEALREHAMREVQRLGQEIEQEPVAWKLPDKNVVFWEDTKEVDEYHGFKPTIPLYPHPQRTWVGLTEDDWDDIFGVAMTIGEAIKTTEAKLKEKNT